MQELKKKIPRVAVGVFIFNQKGELFLMRSPKWRSRFVVPGGKLEYAESLEDCARREVKEETGLDIFAVSNVGTQEAIFPKDFIKRRHFIFFNLIAKTKSKKVVLNDEGKEYVWVPPTKVLRMNLVSETRKFLKSYLKEKTR